MNKASGAPRLDTVGSETSEPAVTVRDLHKRYGGVAAVNGLDL